MAADQDILRLKQQIELANQDNMQKHQVGIDLQNEIREISDKNQELDEELSEFNAKFTEMDEETDQQ